MNPSLEPRNRAGRTPRSFHGRYGHALNHHPLPQVSNLPIHRSIVVVDVVSFTHPDRDNVDQLAIRDALYRTLRDAFEDSGIPWRQTIREDRGDGVLIFVSADVSKVLLLGKLPARLGELLDRGNAQRTPRQRFRLRVAVHAGEVHHDAHGYAGYDVNLAFRLVDAQPLRAAMAGNQAPVGLIVSESVHDGVLRHRYGGLDPAAFQQVRVQVKTVDVAAWIQLPTGGPVPAPRSEALVLPAVDAGGKGKGKGGQGVGGQGVSGQGVSGQANGGQGRSASGDPGDREGGPGGPAGQAGQGGPGGRGGPGGPGRQPGADGLGDLGAHRISGISGISSISGSAADDPVGPVAVLLADEASLLDDLAGLGVRTVVLVGGAAGLAETLAPIARQAIYIEHEFIE